MRGDPGDQGAARGARRHERAPHPRNRQRHHELRADGDGRRGEYADALADAQARGYAEADPTDDVSGADAAAKMAILASVAFNTRVALDDVDHIGITEIDPLDVAAARELEMVVRLVGAARLVDGAYDVRVEPAFVDAQHPLAKVDGAFNGVMLQGDAIREITLAGPGAGGTETASAIVADIAGVLGTTGCRRATRSGATSRGCRPASRGHRSTSGSSSRTGRARWRTSPRFSRATRSRSRASCSTRTAAARPCTSSRTRPLPERSPTPSPSSAALAEVRRRSRPIPVVSDRGVAELGWA